MNGEPAPKTFAGVLAGKVPVHVVAEDGAHLAFLAERPVRPGHVVVTTKRVSDQVFELPPAEHAALWAFVRDVAQQLQARLPCERVCASVIGWVVRHAHVHLVPTDAPGQVPGLDGPPLDDATARALAARLRG